MLLKAVWNEVWNVTAVWNEGMRFVNVTAVWNC